MGSWSIGCRSDFVYCSCRVLWFEAIVNKYADLPPAPRLARLLIDVVITIR